jgi:hypothetical protein
MHERARTLVRRIRVGSKSRHYWAGIGRWRAAYGRRLDARHAISLEDGIVAHTIAF